MPGSGVWQAGSRGPGWRVEPAPTHAAPTPPRSAPAPLRRHADEVVEHRVVEDGPPFAQVVRVRSHALVRGVDPVTGHCGSRPWSISGMNPWGTCGRPFSDGARCLALRGSGAVRAESRVAMRPSFGFG